MKHYIILNSNRYSPYAVSLPVLSDSLYPLGFSDIFSSEKIQSKKRDEIIRGETQSADSAR